MSDQEDISPTICLEAVRPSFQSDELWGWQLVFQAPGPDRDPVNLNVWEPQNATQELKMEHLWPRIASTAPKMCSDTDLKIIKQLKRGGLGVDPLTE